MKTYKQYTNLPKFRLIIDTTNTPYSYIGKFLSSDFLAPLTLNQYSVEDSFEAFQCINNIPTEYRIFSCIISLRPN